MAPAIPPEIEEKYEGRWIAWDTDANQLVAAGNSMQEVIDSAKEHVNRTRHLIWYHHVIKKNAVFVGGVSHLRLCMTGIHNSLKSNPMASGGSEMLCSKRL